MVETIRNLSKSKNEHGKIVSWTGIGHDNHHSISFLLFDFIFSFSFNVFVLFFDSTMCQTSFLVKNSQIYFKIPLKKTGTSFDKEYFCRTNSNRQFLIPLIKSSKRFSIINYAFIQPQKISLVKYRKLNFNSVKICDNYSLCFGIFTQDE